MNRSLVLCLLNGWCFVAPRLACGEARGGSIPRSGAVTDEQRSHRPTWGQPEGRQVFSVQASLLAPYRSTSGYARRSRLAWTENLLPQNTSHLGDTTLERGSKLHALQTLRAGVWPVHFAKRLECFRLAGALGSGVQNAIEFGAVSPGLLDVRCWTLDVSRSIHR